MWFKNGLHLIQIIEKKIVKKYAELMNWVIQATGGKKAIGLIPKAAKLKIKFDNY